MLYFVHEVLGRILDLAWDMCVCVCVCVCGERERGVQYIMYTHKVSHKNTITVYMRVLASKQPFFSFRSE